MLRSGLRAGSLLLLAVIATGLSWVVGRWWLDAGNQPLRVTWLAAGLLLAMAVVVLVMGWRMRRHQRGQARVEPLLAARILALAQASALTGAVVGGGYLGQALVLLPDLDFGGRGTIALWDALAGLGGLLVAGAGLIVQSWCRIVEDDDEGEDGEQRRSRPSA
ncbi:hypothetical protein GCM10027055_09910 [Janibacter alkaliphilus]|uniref:DUF3180 domain-containing protein n=1 Tax=Janibacter alkaliphilus TaxID=1069963 RepID=A0A852WY37_9MICO|nr:hypothetical protein [Janibacter alkaliphilus]